MYSTVDVMLRVMQVYQRPQRNGDLLISGKQFLRTEILITGRFIY